MSLADLLRALAGCLKSSRAIKKPLVLNRLRYSGYLSKTITASKHTGFNTLYEHAIKSSAN